jgi:hypothetical protein
MQILLQVKRAVPANAQGENAVPGAGDHQCLGPPSETN